MAGKIKAVTLDLWQTILLERNGHSARRNAIRCVNLSRAFAEIGVQVSATKLDSVLKDLSSWLTSTWKLDKDVTHFDQIRFITEKVAGGTFSLERERFERLSLAYATPIFELPPYLDPASKSVLRFLKDNGKGTGLISNVGMTPGFALRRFLEMEGIAHYFDVMVFSDEAGVRKPNPSIFKLAAGKLGSSPSEMAHIGDDLRSDVWGAKNAGCKAIHLSTDIGIDKEAEKDPSSLVWISRQLSKRMEQGEVSADWTITSLGQVVEAIDLLER
ncbi:MAG: HAD-IA family hydrolase [Thermoproteota archaeon]